MNKNKLKKSKSVLKILVQSKNFSRIVYLTKEMIEQSKYPEQLLWKEVKEVWDTEKTAIRDITPANYSG